MKHTSTGQLLLKGLALFILFLSLMTFAIMTLWNSFMPRLFGLPHLCYGDALSLLVLMRLLTGIRFGFLSSPFSKIKEKQYWKEKMMARLENMNPEERRKLENQWKNNCNMEEEEEEK